MVPAIGRAFYAVCGLCILMSSSKPVSACSDNSEHCEYWAHTGHCQTSSAYMSTTCCASCSGASTCNDQNEHCAYWAENGHCETSYDYMKDHCCQSCGTGGGGGATCESVWYTRAGDYACGARIEYLREVRGMRDGDARNQVAREYSNECGPCGTGGSVDSCGGDLNEHCAYWSEHGYCQSSPDYMRENCCTSCSVGGQDPGPNPTPAPNPTPSPVDGCGGDLSEHCAYWSQNGYCQSSPDYMGQNCCASCGFGGHPGDGVGDGHCKPLSVQAAKHRALNVVLVPSAFHGNMALWREKAHWITEAFSQYKPLDAANIPGLNIWYVDVDMPGDNGAQCYFGCYNTPRLLCCPGRHQFIQHAANHCGTGFIMSTLIIHNSDTYGGAGYTSDNAATCSTNSLAPQIAVHELGHSLFGLGDEYTYGSATAARQPNCDVAGCPKWADLQGRWGVACKPNKCQGGGYYAAEDSMMDVLGLKFGEANERIMCCKYLYHFQTAPGFCSKFSQDGLNLNTYCAGNVWRGDFTNVDSAFKILASGEDADKAHMERVSADEQGAGYMYVENPVEWIVGKPALSEAWVCTRSPNKLQSGVYLKERVMGDVATVEEPDEAISSIAASRHTIKVFVVKEKAIVRKMSFFELSAVSVPPQSDTSDQLQEKGAADADQVSEPRASISIILTDGETCDLRVGDGDLLSAAPLSVMAWPSFSFVILLGCIASNFRFDA